MAIKLTNGEEYTLAKIAGTAAVIDGSDHAHAIKTFRNNVHITASADSDGIIFLQQSTGTQGRPLALLRNKNSGTHADATLGFRTIDQDDTDQQSWSIGLDKSKNAFVIRAATSFALYGSNEFQVDAGGNAIFKGSGSFKGGIIKDPDEEFIQIPQQLKIESFGSTYALQCLNKRASAEPTPHASGSSRAAYFIAGETTGSTSGNTNTIFRIDDGDGTSLSFVTYTNGNVNWSAFTGTHPAYIKPDQSSPILETQTASGQMHNEFEVGMIVRSVQTGTTWTGSYQPAHHITTSSIFQDKRVLGVYGGSFPALIEENEPAHQHNVWSLGDGMIYVCNENGNIEMGDYITTASGSNGYGCKQNDDILHNYTVAKSLTDVDWSKEPSASKLIPCTIHCG